jgi:integral membrane protein (TIGR01906 family)
MSARRYDGGVNRSAVRWVATGGVALATVILVLGIGVAALFNPPFVAFEQSRASSTAWTGYTTEELRTATDAILGDLYFGGPFDVTVRGEPVLDPREQAHMRDVRGVFAGFYVAVLLSALVLLVAGWRARREAWFWRATRSGAIVLSVGVVVLGVVSLVAFDALFEVFHRIFFAGGTYTFDPRTERLVQLFPDQFWSETSIVLGGLLLALAGAVVLVGRNRGRTAPDADPDVRIAAAEAAR